MTAQVESASQGTAEPTFDIVSTTETTTVTATVTECPSFWAPHKRWPIVPAGIVVQYTRKDGEAAWLFTDGHIHGSRLREDGTHSGLAASSLHIRPRGRDGLDKYPDWVRWFVDGHRPGVS